MHLRHGQGSQLPKYKGLTGGGAGQGPPALQTASRRVRAGLGRLSELGCSVLRSSKCQCRSTCTTRWRVTTSLMCGRVLCRRLLSQLQRPPISLSLWLGRWLAGAVVAVATVRLETARHWTWKASRLSLSQPLPTFQWENQGINGLSSSFTVRV